MGVGGCNCANVPWTLLVCIRRNSCGSCSNRDRMTRTEPEGQSWSEGRVAGVTACWCHCLLVSLLAGVTVCWCHCLLVSLFAGVTVADVTVCWCRCLWVSLLAGVTACWCHSLLVSLLLVSLFAGVTVASVTVAGVTAHCLSAREKELREHMKQAEGTHRTDKQPHR